MAKNRVVQLSYAKVTGSPEDVYPATAKELFELYLEFAGKVREEKPGLSPGRIRNIAMARTKKTIEEMTAAGMALPPAGSAWERYERMVRGAGGNGKCAGGPQSGAESRRAASYARTLVRRTKSRR